MSSTAKTGTRHAQASLENLLSEIEESECKTSMKRKVGREPIDLNAPELEKSKPEMRQQQSTHNNYEAKKRDKLIPTFSSVPIKTPSYHPPSKQTNLHTPPETYERRSATHKPQEQRQFELFVEAKYPKTRHYQQPQKQFARQFTRKKHQHHNHHIQSKNQPYPISFQETIIYDDVAISICFGNYKMQELQINPQTVLVVPFSDLECNSQLILDVEKRSQTNIKRILENQLDSRNVSNYRTGEIVALTCLLNIPYKQVYFNKTPNNQGLANFLLQKLCQNVKSLIQKAQSDGAKCIVFGEWMWSSLQLYQISSMTFKAIIDGIKLIGAVKGLRSVKLLIGKKSEYQAYVKAFREMSDQYLEAFYRE